MAVKSAYYGSMGPFEYESTTTYADGKRFKGFRGRAKLEGDADDAPLNIETLVAPTSPDDGDIWVLTTGMYARINGVTVLISGAGGSVAIGNTLSGDVTATFEADGDTPVTIPTSVISTFGRTLTDDADAATARTTLGLGSIATQAANNVAITGGTINGTTIGASTPSSGAFTTGSFTGTVTGVAANFSGIVTMATASKCGTGTGGAAFLVDGGAGSGRAINFYSGGSIRLQVRCSEHAESSTYNGSLFAVSVYNNSGVFVDNALFMSRDPAGDFDIARRIDCSQNINVATGKVFTINSTQIGLSNGLAGVNVSSPSVGQVLVYDSGDSRFENMSISEAIGGVAVLSVNTTAVGNVGAGEDNLMTYTLPASRLASDGDSLFLEATFTVDPTANNRIKMWFGGTAFYDSGAYTPASTDNVWLRATVTRLNSSSVGVTTEARNTDGGLSGFQIATIGGLTFTNTQTIKATGESGTSTTDDVIQNILKVVFFDKP